MKNQISTPKIIDVAVKDTLTSKDRAIWILAVLLLLLVLIPLFS